MAGTVKPIKVGSLWNQRTVLPDGTRLLRVIEIIGAPTLSSPANYRIVRNDGHPHREGKTASIRRGDLRRKYRAGRS